MNISFLKQYKKAVGFIPLLAAGVLMLVFLALARSAPAAMLQDLPYDRVVVQAFFETREMVASLASWTEPWEVDYENKYVVLEVNAFEYQRLVEAGFRVLMDDRLTEQINSPPQRLPGQVAGLPG